MIPKFPTSTDEFERGVERDFAGAKQKFSRSVSRTVQKPVRLVTDQSIVDFLYGNTSSQDNGLANKMPGSGVEQIPQPVNSSNTQPQKPVQYLGGLDDLHKSYQAPVNESSTKPRTKEEEEDQRETHRLHDLQYYSELRDSQNPELDMLEQQVRRESAEKKKKEQEKQQQGEEEQRQEEEKKQQQMQEETSVAPAGRKTGFYLGKRYSKTSYNRRNANIDKERTKIERNRGISG